MVEHEYCCSCGHRGWTRHVGILDRPYVPLHVGDKVRWNDDTGVMVPGVVVLTSREEPWLARSGEIGIARTPNHERIFYRRREEIWPRCV